MMNKQANLKNLLKLLCVSILFSLTLFVPITTQADTQVNSVRGVLFFSPSCAHCQKVLNDVLPPLVEKYGENLIIAKIDVSLNNGQNLYKDAVKQFKISEDRIGVPTLIMGDVIMVGSFEIPNQLPGLIEKALTTGGLDWPALPGLEAFVSNLDNTSSAQSDPFIAATTPESTPQEQTQPSSSLISNFANKFAQDRVGNSIAVIVLLAMILSTGWVIFSFLRGDQGEKGRWPRWAIPVLVVLGLIIAGYLSYVEISEADAICGPVGNCNAVQRSPYATLFGFLPVGILGAIGYLSIGATWLLQRFASDQWQKILAIAAWAFAWFGILFTIYLTFLEPFIIGATCAWCISSAIVVTLIFFATTGPAINALQIEDEDELD